MRDTCEKCGTVGFCVLTWSADRRRIDSDEHGRMFSHVRLVLCRPCAKAELAAYMSGPKEAA